MANPTFSLAINPKWYIADNLGRPAGAATMFTFRSLNKTETKNVFTDPNGVFPYAQPVRFDLNGSQGPIYWEFDPNNPNELYFIEVFDRNGVLLWTQDNFSPPGGGGGNVINNISLKNYVTNNNFWRGAENIPSPVPIGTVIAPSNHDRFQSPDIIFFKTSTANIDQMQIIAFPLGTTPFTGDITSPFYLHYQCNTVIPGETDKRVQFPIAAKVNIFENQTVTVSLWAKAAIAGQFLNINIAQFFGNGGAPSPTNLGIIQTITLTTTWQKYVLTFVIPSTGLMTIGTCGNDGVYLQINYPLSVQCNIDIAKISFYLGNINPSSDFDSFDQSDAIINSPRTGDIRTTLNNFGLGLGGGWLPMDNGSIGSAFSGATHANINTFFLYQTLWNNVSQAFAPVIGGRGASAIDDFANNKPMTLTQQVGRVIAGSDFTIGTLGLIEGERTHILTIPEMPFHNHPGSVLPVKNIITDGLPPFLFVPGASFSSSFDFATQVDVAAQGADQPHNNIQPTVYNNMFIKL